MHIQTHCQRSSPQACSTSYASCSYQPHVNLRALGRKPYSLQQPTLSENSSHTSCRALTLGSPMAQTADSLPSPERLVVGFNERIPSFATIPEALAAVARGEVVVVLDDEDRENEGDLIMAADLASPETLHFIIDNSSGVVCVGMEGSHLDRLRIPLMVDSRENDESMYTAFTVTVDLRQGTSTGISAADRALTIKALANPNTQPQCHGEKEKTCSQQLACQARARADDAFNPVQDLRRPGHIFPLRARPGGVLTRPGHTEASVDLARMAGCSPAGVMCEVVNKNDGSMARTPELLAFAEQHGLCCVTIADLIKHRLATESLAQLCGSEVVQSAAGPVSVSTYTAFEGAFEVLLFRCPGHTMKDGPQRLHVRTMDLMADVFSIIASGSNSNGAAPPLPLPQLVCQVAGGQDVLVYICPQRFRSPPEHLARALDRDPCGGPRALELALVASILCDQGYNMEVVEGLKDMERESLLLWQQHRLQAEG